MHFAWETWKNVLENSFIFINCDIGKIIIRSNKKYRYRKYCKTNRVSSESDSRATQDLRYQIIVKTLMVKGIDKSINVLHILSSSWLPGQLLCTILQWKSRINSINLYMPEHQCDRDNAYYVDMVVLFIYSTIQSSMYFVRLCDHVNHLSRRQLIQEIARP